MGNNGMLIVEDQAYMRRLLREFLQMAHPDVNILEAGDASSALALLRSNNARLVLMDVGLPDGNGIELTAQIKSQWPDIAVIIVSANASPAYVEHARAAGACAYVVKDHVYRDLLGHVRNALLPAATGGPGLQPANG